MNGLAEGVLIRSEHFHTLVEALPVALYMTDADGRITYYNDAAAKLWGRSPKIGEDWWCGSWRLYRPDGKPMAHDECPMAQALKTGRPVLGAMAIAERPDGTRFPFIPYPSPIFDAKGRVTGAVNMLFDISNWSVAEEAKQRLAAIVESSDDAIISKDLNGIIRTWNQAAERLFGYKASEIIGKSILTIIPRDRNDEETTIISRIRRGERIEHYETLRQRKDGSLVDVSLTVSPVKDKDGKVVGASKIARDISERKRKDRATEIEIEERRRAERANQLLVNEIKHRVKNTLGTVQAMAAQTFRQAPVEERDAFVGRLHALAEAHDALTQRDWGNVALSNMTARALNPFVEAARRRISSRGADVELTPNRALLISMVLHELCTNSVKYGALSNDDGTVDVLWDTADEDGKTRKLRLTWTERGGPAVSEPRRKGFGSRMIEHAIRGEQGASEFRFAPEGLVCKIEMPI